MDPATMAITLALIDKALRYGAPAVIAAIRKLDVEEPTLTDIQGLRIEGDPEDYFK